MRAIVERRRSKQKWRSIRSSFLVLSCSHVALVAASAAGNGVLPPPPPPPPPPLISQSILAGEKSDVPDKGSDGVSSTLTSAQGGQETEQSPEHQRSVPKVQSGSAAYDKEDFPAPEEDKLSTKQTDQGQQNAWEYQVAGSSAATKLTEQQQTQSQYLQQEWGYQQQPSSQYQDQYYTRQWQQSQDQDSSSSPQSYYQQQPQQQRQPHSQFRTTAQSQQLIHYNRPQPQSAKASASRLFSMAVRKIQTGIDTVSESLDTNKVASSVSSLTSRFSDVVSSGVGLSGSRGGQPVRPRPVGAGAGMMQRQHDQRQRIDPRRGTGPKQEYAPPMSELYSFDVSGQAGESHDASGVNDSVGEENEWKGYEERKPNKELEGTTQHPDLQSRHSELQHETDTDDESEMSHAGSRLPDMFEAPSQPVSMHPKVRASIPPKASGFRQTQQMRQGLPRDRRPPERGPVKNRTTDSWPNGGSMASSSTPPRRQYKDYDDDYESSIGSKVKSVIGSVPVPNIPRLFKGMRSSRGSYDDGVWSDDESREKTKSVGMFGRKEAPSTQSAQTVGSSLQGRRASARPLNNAVVPRPVMSLLEKRNSLVSSAGARRCASVGRTQAILDAGQLALIVFALHEVLPVLHKAVSSNAGELRSAVLSTILSAFDGWAPYALCAAFLLSASNSAWVKPSLKALSSEVAAESEAESAYSQLYLRLISSIPMKKSFPEVVRKAARAEAVNAIAISRLHFFTILAVAYVLLSTVAVLEPAGAAVLSAIIHSIKLDAWKATPIVWSAVLKEMKSVALDLVGSLRCLFFAELEEVRRQPLRVVVVVSLLSALILVSYLPSLERSRKSNPSGYVEEDEAEDTIVSLWSAIGSSSATRLGMLSSPRGVEGALDQFSKLRPDRAASAGMLLPQGNAKLIKKKRKQQRSSLILGSVHSLLREVAYLVSSLLLLLVPLAIYTYVWAKPENADGTLSLKAIPIDGWASLLDMAALLVMTNIQVGRAAHCAIGGADARLGTSLTTFFRTLSTTVDELQKLAASSANSDFQAMLTASPTEGVVVTDFWAAHSTRKAWAVKGANVQCKNGEVVLVIGSDGAGKSRLLTSISEHIFAPPKSARTTTYARGSISVAGVDLSKWDRNQLQRRVGVWLNDVRTVSDYASLVTGCTLEEILEPVPLVGGAPSRQTGAKEKNAMVLAMKITGLGSKLSTRLPSKLSTVVSANEDELKPSPLRPPSYPLSPSDWSRVLLTKVLAQLIAGNDNQQSPPNSIARCLVGSILLLDDATLQMSEVDEAHCITALRSTGAAVILTSNRWATGRFADRIVVIENGSVVESGTHEDLINLGPERSLYARQWNAMASI